MVLWPSASALFSDNGRFVSFQVLGDWVPLRLQQDPHEALGNGNGSTAKSGAQVPATARLNSTGCDEGRLCICQRLRRQKSHELFWQRSFLRIRTEDRSCNSRLVSKLIHPIVVEIIRVSVITCTCTCFIASTQRTSLPSLLWGMIFQCRVCISFLFSRGFVVSHCVPPPVFRSLFVWYFR